MLQELVPNLLEPNGKKLQDTQLEISTPTAEKTVTVKL